MKTRQPAVAGYFYPAGGDDLLARVDGFLEAASPPRDVTMAIMPHAGYVYSGKTAGLVAGSVQVPRRVILLGPKHRHGGRELAVSGATEWEFPFGRVPVDRDMADMLVNGVDGLEFDDLAHEGEHSIEVQIPFLWRRNPEIAITPIAVGMGRGDDLRRLGEQLARVLRETGEPVLIVASTDMSHQVPIDEAARLDHLAIDRILKLDPTGLYKTVVGHGITMCGVMPVTAGLHACLAIGAGKAELVEYTTSADASGDTGSVVGYAGMVVYD